MNSRQIITGSLVGVTMLLGACKDSTEHQDFKLTTVARGSAALQSFDSCAELEERLKENLRQEMKSRILAARNEFRYVNQRDVYENSKVANDDKAESASPKEGVDYSGTNNQEAGVDEADFVKTDGSYIYLLNKGVLRIVAVPEFGQLQKSGSINIEGQADSMLLAKKGGDTVAAVVFSRLYYWDTRGTPVFSYLNRFISLTKITLIDLADKANPKVWREIYLEGSLNTSRLVDNVARLVTYSWLDIDGLQYYPEVPDDIEHAHEGTVWYERLLDEGVQKSIDNNETVISKLTLADFMPVMLERDRDGHIEKIDFTAQQCRNFQMAEDGVSRGINSIFTMDLLSDGSSWDVEHVVADNSVVYSSKDTLVLAEPAQNYWWYWSNSSEEEATNIHRFDISEGTVYSGSARIPGTIENQFSLSEQSGVIRAAVTKGTWNRWWLASSSVNESAVYTLAGPAGKLEVLGHVDGIAPTERIYSARFIGDRGYVVTFRNTDPLWTIDLSDPATPKVIGELQVPGVSTYIHPLDGDSFLLTIGYGGNDGGLNWQPQISLFDVRDFANPRLASTLVLGDEFAGGYWYWASSSALYEHKAFQYWGPMNMLAVPMTIERDWYDDNEYYWELRSYLDLINVDTVAGLSSYNKVEHSGFYSKRDAYYTYGGEISRSIFMGEYIYAISPGGITCHKLSDMSLTSKISL